MKDKSKAIRFEDLERKSEEEDWSEIANESQHADVLKMFEKISNALEKVSLDILGNKPIAEDRVGLLIRLL